MDVRDIELFVALQLMQKQLEAQTLEIMSLKTEIAELQEKVKLLYK